MRLLSILFLIFLNSSQITFAFDKSIESVCLESEKCLGVLNDIAINLSLDTLEIIQDLNKQFEKSSLQAKNTDNLSHLQNYEDTYYLFQNYRRIKNRCEELINQASFELLFNDIEPCAILDFTRMATWKRNVGIYSGERLSIRALEELASQIARKDRFKKYHIPGGKRKQLENSLNTLVTKMKDLSIKSVSLSGIVLFAERELNKRKERGEIGGCYIVESKKGFIMPHREYVSLDANSQQEVEELFRFNGSKIELSENEKRAIGQDRLRLEEIKELRAIRKATEIFEKNTFLKDDEAGGFWSNFKGELFGGGQQNCVDEEITYRKFLSSLDQQGLLKNFYPGNSITKRMSLKDDWSDGGHVAGTLIHRRTGEVFVIDSWYEPGGSPAHIQTKEDWLKTPISYFGELDFNDVVEVAE